MIRTRVGYAGGTTPDPTYHNLAGHSETVEVDFDPNQISYDAILDIFWDSHEPTYAVRSRQYISAIFFHDERQRATAVESKQIQEKKTGKMIFTEITGFTHFYRAEDYHQKYALQRNTTVMEEFRSMYPNFRTLVDSTAAARVNGYLGGCGTFEDLREEIAQYGLSPSASWQLSEVVKASTHFACRH